MADHKRQLGNAKISYDISYIRDELKMLDMSDLSALISDDKEYMLVEKLITFADIPTFAKCQYISKLKNSKDSFSKAKIKDRVSSNALFYNTYEEMYKYEMKNKKDKKFFVETKQGNIDLPQTFYDFIESPRPRTYMNPNKEARDSRTYPLLEEDGFTVYLVNESLKNYFIPTMTKKCLDKLNKSNVYNDKKSICLDWIIEDSKYIKIPLSVGVHGIGTKNDEVFHKLRGNIFARDKIIVLAEKTKGINDKKVNIYLMFFRNPKFFKLLGLSVKAYSRALFTDNLDASKEENRKGQAKWRDMLAEYSMSSDDSKIITCPISNISIDYDREGTLFRASHIKEYCKCKNSIGKVLVDEAYNINNGLLITADADALFDKHMISINPINGCIVFSKLISDDLKKTLKFNSKISNEYLTEERIPYLEYHYNEFKELELERRL